MAKYILVYKEIATTSIVIEADNLDEAMVVGDKLLDSDLQEAISNQFSVYADYETVFDEAYEAYYDDDLTFTKEDVVKALEE